MVLVLLLIFHDNLKMPLYAVSARLYGEFRPDTYGKLLPLLFFTNDGLSDGTYSVKLLFKTIFQYYRKIVPRRQLQITTDDNYKCTFYIASPRYRATSRGRE